VGLRRRSPPAAAVPRGDVALPGAGPGSRSGRTGLGRVPRLAVVRRVPGGCSAHHPLGQDGLLVLAGGLAQLFGGPCRPTRSRPCPSCASRATASGYGSTVLCAPGWAAGCSLPSSRSATPPLPPSWPGWPSRASNPDPVPLPRDACCLRSSAR
jgi:hypothetical protein